MNKSDENFFQRISKPNAVLKFLKNGNHSPYIIELEGDNPVIIDLLGSLIPLAQKIKNPKSEVKRKLSDLIAMLISAQMGKADVMAQELFIRESVNNFDEIFEPILKESNFLD